MKLETILAGKTCRRWFLKFIVQCDAVTVASFNIFKTMETGASMAKVT